MFVLPVISAIGFTPAGVAAGSYAAAWHSTIGNVAAGSLFATLQSMGAGGISAMAAETLASCGIAAGAAVAAVAAAVVTAATAAT